MENSSDTFSEFCDYQKIFEYFNEFLYLLQDSDHDLEFLEISKCFKCLQFISKDNFFSTHGREIDHEKFFFILLQIFDALCLKYFGCSHNCYVKLEKSSNLTYLYDSVALIIKIIAPKLCDRISLKIFFNHLTSCFYNYSVSHKNISDENDMEREHLQCLLKFFFNILQSLGPAGILIHISDDIITSIIQSYPFFYKEALTLFVNKIAPKLFSECDYCLKRRILELMWEKIICNYKENSCSLTESYHSLLLCCFSDYMFKECYELKNFNLFDDTIWKIVQNNLTVDSSYTRKQALYVLKMILFWIKSNNIIPKPSPYVSVHVFSLSTIKDLLIWNDLVILFESLEEKQIHVIKPVLPKFSRIIQQGFKNYDVDAFILHPSWITCFIKRMIFHESKFIKKQALSIAMNINFKRSLIHQLHSKEFISLLIEGFNDQSMYCRVKENDNLSLFLSSEKIANFLTNYIQAFETTAQKVGFSRYLLKIIASHSWCGVALMHLTYALTNLESLPSWNISEDVKHIREIIQGCLKTHESVIRRAIEHWLLKSCILFIDWKSAKFETIADLLFIFKTFEYDSAIWNAFVLKLKELFSTSSAEMTKGPSDDPSRKYEPLTACKAKQFASSCIGEVLRSEEGFELNPPSKHELQKFATFLVLLADSHVISSKCGKKQVSWLRLLKPITSFLMNAPYRPYMQQGLFYTALQFSTFLIDVSFGTMGNLSKVHHCVIISCFNCSDEFLEFILQKSLMDIKGSNDIIRFQILFNFLHTLSSVTKFSHMFVKLLPNFLANYDKIPSHFLSKKAIIILLYEVSNRQLFDPNFINKSHLNPFRELSLIFLSKIVTGHVINDLLKTAFINETEKEEWQKLVVLLVNKFWKIACCTTNSLVYFEQKDLILALVQLAEDVFNGGSKATYASTISCIEVLIPKLGLSNIHIVDRLLNIAYKACSELQGCEAYRPAIDSFIKTVFQPFMLNEKCFDILYKYISCFQNLSENSLGIFYLVIKRFCDIFPLTSLYKMNFNYIPFIMHSLTYGPIHQKSQKILEDSIAIIRDQDEYFSTELKNYNKPHIFVRITAVKYLLYSLYQKTFESEEIALQIIDALLSFDKSIKTSRTSTFTNSYHHRVRNRIWQCILLLQPNILSESENVHFLKKILDLLEFENQQPSIRYLQEWLILNILIINEDHLKNFISILENSPEKRPGFLVSLLSILINLIRHNFILSEDQVSKCFPILISYCMAQNFAVRLYSRLALKKLYFICEEYNFTNLIQKYDYLCNFFRPQEHENSLLEKGNINKNLAKLQEEFYFSVFHPIKHFTLETIFYELPRLSNLAPEEWIKAKYFNLDFDFDFKLIPCFNSDSSLKNVNTIAWNNKSTEEPLVDNDSYDYNFQRKICPVKSEIYDCFSDLSIETKPKQSNLIVIASLIDKIPNLGGLCRTCEVFGVEQFVIGSWKYTEDKTFQNLAVSSDKWVSIKEVKPHHLKEYLLSLKEEGYTIIGAEQTDDSYKLSDYVFQKKSALILGHEKEGMPVDLIQVLDACVEIPQQGIIRSLNVHVSGAIFIWEYARQQIKP